MNLDQLIAHLQSLREAHGGSIEVMLGQQHPENDKLWSGCWAITPEMIRESVTVTNVTSVPRYGQKAGWIWFQVPEDGIKHR